MYTMMKSVPGGAMPGVREFLIFPLSSFLPSVLHFSSSFFPSHTNKKETLTPFLFHVVFIWIGHLDKL